MEVLTILYNMHVKETINNPLTHIEINIENVKMISTENELKIKCNQAYEKFKELKELIGSVDENPETWARICYLKIIEAKENNASVVSLPNGCCTKTDCPINKFYGLFIDVLSE